MMVEFFRGWRRKIGVATLLIALVLVAGWARSHRVVDEIKIRIDKDRLFWLISQNDWFGFVSVDGNQNLNVPGATGFKWSTDTATNLDNIGPCVDEIGPFAGIAYYWDGMNSRI